MHRALSKDVRHETRDDEYDPLNPPLCCVLVNVSHVTDLTTALAGSARLSEEFHLFDICLP